MSLISEALKKVQKGRGVPNSESGNKENEIENGGKEFEIKRVLFIVVPLLVVVAIVYFTFLTDDRLNETVKQSDQKIPLLNNPEKPALDKNIKSEGDKKSENQIEEINQLEKQKPDFDGTPKAKKKNSVETVKINKVQEYEKEKKVKKQTKSSDLTRISEPRIKKSKDQELTSAFSKKPKINKKEYTPQNAGENLKTRAGQLFSNKKYLEAVELYKQILKTGQTENIYLKVYSCYKRLNNDILANYYIEQGVKAFPQSFYLNKISAIISIREKKYLYAIQNIQTALQQGREDYSLNTYLGLSYFHQKKYDLALGQFKISLDLNINAIENYYYIGLIYDNKKQFDKALQFYKLFLKLNKENKFFKHKKWIISRIKLLES